MEVQVRPVAEFFGFVPGSVGRQYAGALRNSFAIHFGGDLYFARPVYRRRGYSFWLFTKEDGALSHSYELHRHADGFVKCSCPGAAKMRDGRCRHVKMLVENVLPLVS